jgi:competence protein ComEC
VHPTQRIVTDGPPEEPGSGGRTPPGRAGYGIPLSALSRAWRAFAVHLSAQLSAEADRWILWIPVAIGAGVAFYFALPVEPPLWAGMVALGGAAVLLFLPRDGGIRLLLAMPLALVLGFAAGQVRTQLAAGPVLERPLPVRQMTGRIMAVERIDGAQRVTLADPTIAGLEPARTPARLRLRLPQSWDIPPIGTVVGIRAAVRPPPRPVAPGAYDHGRHLYFQRIGAVGYAVSPPTVLVEREAGPFESIAQALVELRRRIASSVEAELPGPAGAVATALLAGEQAAVPEAVMEDMRDAGLAHLLSISGLHVTLVAGLVFVVVRALLAMIEPLALRYPIKKWAVVPALAAAAGYMLLVGAPVPTQRSVLMTGLVLLAILLDRTALGMRLVALAAAVVVLTQPESLLGPSFQMSFGAVILLVAGFEVLGPHWSRWKAALGPVGRSGLYLAGVAASSVLATAATLPFGLYHFQQIQFYGILANMVAVPLTSFWVMPLGMLACLLMPFGLEAWPLTAMGWGLDGIMSTAALVAGLPAATLAVPAMPGWGLAAAVSGGLWMAVWTGRWRLLGALPVVLGLLSVLLAPRPDLLVSEDGDLLALRGSDGRLSLSTARAARFEAGVWLRRDGQEGAGTVWPAAGSAADGRLACDALGCIWRPLDAGPAFALPRRREALMEDCERAGIVVSPVLAVNCPAPLVVDLRKLRRDGAHAFHLEGGQVRLVSVEEERGLRPWSSRWPRPGGEPDRGRAEGKGQ